MEQKFLITLLLFFGFFYIVTCDHKNILRLCKIECIVTEIIASNYSCKVKALTRTRTVINAEGYILRPVDDILVNMQIFKKNSVKYLPFLVNVTVNICKFLEGNRQSFYATFMMGWVQRYSNANHTCPYSGHLYARNLEPFAEKIPAFAPAGDYRLDVHFYEKTVSNWLGTIRGYGTMRVKPFLKQEFF